VLRNIVRLMGYALAAEDGEIGRCHDFLFDDRYWTVRYMVADTGTWLPGRKVLVSPIALGEPDWDAERFPVKLTRKKIEDSPPLEKDAPVSRQYEIKWFNYYGWPYYWVGEGLWGIDPYPHTLYGETGDESQEKEFEPEKSHVRSVKEVTGYHIEASDGKIGHVEDFLVDEQAWSLRYLVVDTRNWLPGRKVLVKPSWVNSVDWADRRVSIALTIESIKNSPEYDPAVPLTPDYESRLHAHYNLPIEQGFGPL